MSNNLLTPDDDVKKTIENGGVAIIETNFKSHERHMVMWGSGGASLTREHIDALLAGHTLTFAVEEYQVFITMEGSDSNESE